MLISLSLSSSLSSPSLNIVHYHYGDCITFLVNTVVIDTAFIYLLFIIDSGIVKSFTIGMRGMVKE